MRYSCQAVASNIIFLFWINVFITIVGRCAVMEIAVRGRGSCPPWSICREGHPELSPRGFGIFFFIQYKYCSFTSARCIMPRVLDGPIRQKAMHQTRNGWWCIKKHFMPAKATSRNSCQHIVKFIFMCRFHSAALESSSPRHHVGRCLRGPQ